jgi:hypothetical protein
VEDHIQYLLQVQEAARNAIVDAQQVQHRHANWHQSNVANIKEGDWVLLQRKQVERGKLAPIADGPFKVTKVSTNAITLKLPENSKAHPTVNISRIQLYFGPRPEIFRRMQHSLERISSGRRYLGAQCKSQQGSPEPWDKQKI